MEPRSARDVEILESRAEVYCFRLNFSYENLTILLITIEVSQYKHIIPDEFF